MISYIDNVITYINNLCIGPTKYDLKTNTIFIKCVLLYTRDLFGFRETIIRHINILHIFHNRIIIKNWNNVKYCLV